MALEIILNGYTIPVADVRKLPRTGEKVSLNGNTLIASKLDIVLDNTDPSLYDDRYVGSIFNLQNWYNSDAEVRDDGQTIWLGRIKGLTVDEKAATLTVHTTNYIQDMAKTPAVINSTGNVTPAELIYNLLTDTTYMALTDDDLVLAGFNEAIAIQTADTVYARCVYTLEKNQNVLQVINELCKITQCHLYAIDNKIYFYQWQEWNGQLGTVINASNAMPLTYSHSYDDSKIFNVYNILYNSGGSTATATGSDATSIAKHGRRIFSVPEDNVDSTTSTDFNILLLNKEAADWCGAQALARYKYMKKTFKVTVGDELKDAKLGDQVDLNFPPFKREPGQITERAYDRDKRTIQLTGEFINTPYEYFDRDTEAPATPELIAVLPTYSKLFIKWTPTYDTDLVGYKLYFTTSSGEWESEMSSRGYSPIDVKNPDLTADGYYYYIVGGLNPGTTYYFRVTAYDTSFNESDPSNTLEGAITTPQVPENFYCTGGSLFAGITLDINNTREGTVPDGFTKYGDGYYDLVYYGATAIYESHLLKTDTLVSRIYLLGRADSADDLKVQWREYDEVLDEYGSWSTAEGAVGVNILEPGVKYVQVRAIFYSTSWTDADTFAVTGID